MTRAVRLFAVFLSVSLLLLTVTGCGKTAEKAKSEKPPKQVSLEELQGPDQKTISSFVTALRPLLVEAGQIHQDTKQTIQKLGYTEITPAQALQQVIAIETKTNQLRAKLDQVAAKGGLEAIKGNFETSLYLKQQNISKLRKYLSLPNPKASELNKILAELDGSEGFLDKAKASLDSIAQSVGMQN